jgi:signal transduction histidine kinase
MRLHGESYGWDSDMKTASKGAQYTSHILKNEVTKIDWCASNLSKKCEQVPEELAIIQRSTEHLLNFANKTQLYSNDIMLQPERVPVKELIRASILSTRDYAAVGVTFEAICGDNAELYCDREHILEVLNNLLSNAADAMEKEGKGTITFSENPA